ncbi:ABC transporter permease [Sporomusa acidovorans]|uniref:Oligopeptide transport system permease protein OppC n=1 Tax=Sporomusa acidovorans (strain ATCC 49682 / DSM 3132 / Mol) TaxID=1123286 RepID=A0ABZ3IXV8_SPOA4|nr:ABC transporter permease [Sporomusa acidovorans]OZC16967.1 oligopeptide transport system permease protein OppC [Sporomusa acidovorans DSM 3132]SDE13961.1 peptide/nickel transport system permease protein [Sporomusa acidovorans]
MDKTNEAFIIVGAQYQRQTAPAKKNTIWQQRWREKPVVSVFVLSIIVLGCIFAGQIMNHDPTNFYLNHLNEAPNAEFYFGTDSLGRDIFSIIWYGGRISLFIGLLGTCILTVVGVFYGCISGTAAQWLDQLMMRAAEMFSSIPTLLMILLLLSIMGTPTAFSIAVVIGLTGWMSLARLVRSEVRQIQSSEYMLAARSIGTPFPRILYKHLLPNFVSAIMFMVVSSVSSCIMMESTLSFLGLGLPVDIVSWGSMLSLANKALLTDSWWVIVIPGAFIVLTLLCITNIGHYLRGEANKKSSNL